MAGFNKGVIIHFNSKDPINCSIRNENIQNFFSVELPDNVRLNICKGDPVVVGVLKEEGITPIGGTIVSATLKDSCIKTLIILSDTKEVLVERRKVKRLPTSLFGIVSRNNMVVSDVCIRDISEIGISIQTSNDFEIDDQVEIDVLLREEVGRFKCSVVRKVQRYNKQEYGLTIVQDEVSIAATRQFINSILDYHKELMSILEK